MSHLVWPTLTLLDLDPRWINDQKSEKGERKSSLLILKMCPGAAAVTLPRGLLEIQHLTAMSINHCSQPLHHHRRCSRN